MPKQTSTKRIGAAQRICIAAADYLRSLPAAVDRISTQRVFDVVRSNGLDLHPSMRKEVTTRWHLAGLDDWLRDGRWFRRIEPLRTGDTTSAAETTDGATQPPSVALTHLVPDGTQQDKDHGTRQDIRTPVRT